MENNFNNNIESDYSYCHAKAARNLINFYTVQKYIEKKDVDFCNLLIEKTPIDNDVMTRLRAFLVPAEFISKSPMSTNDKNESKEYLKSTFNKQSENSIMFLQNAPEVRKLFVSLDKLPDEYEQIKAFLNADNKVIFADNVIHNDKSSPFNISYPETLSELMKTKDWKIKTGLTTLNGEIKSGKIKETDREFFEYVINNITDELDLDEALIATALATSNINKIPMHNGIRTGVKSAFTDCLLKSDRKDIELLCDKDKMNDFYTFVSEYGENPVYDLLHFYQTKDKEAFIENFKKK